MIKGDETSNRFLPRIRQELDKLPLTEEQKHKVAPKLLQIAIFLDTGGQSEHSSGLNLDSAFFDLSRKVDAVVQHFHEDGLTTVDYLKAAVIQPSLFVRSPESMTNNITGVVDRFAADGLTTKAYLHAALAHPQLFVQSPETIVGNITGVVDCFAADGLTLKDYLQAALKNPSMFAQSADRISAHATDVVNRFAADGLTTKMYLQAALKHTRIFTQAPETIVGNITGVLDRFAADGLTTKAYLKAALTQPSLFTSLPKTVIRNIGIVFDFYDRGIVRPPFNRSTTSGSASGKPRYASVLDYLLRKPALMCLADDNYILREVHQKLTDGPTDASVLGNSRHVVERELMQHLGHGDPEQSVPSDGFIAGAAPPTEEQAQRFVLRALMHAGFIRGGSMER